MCSLWARAKVITLSNVYVSGKNNKILPIPETMQGISTSAESKEERNKKKKKKKSDNINRMITVAKLFTVVLVIGCCFINRNLILICTVGSAKCDHLWIVG
jgi:hypothetical protein